MAGLYLNRLVALLAIMPAALAADTKPATKKERSPTCMHCNANECRTDPSCASCHFCINLSNKPSPMPPPPPPAPPGEAPEPEPSASPATSPTSSSQQRNPACPTARCGVQNGPRVRQVSLLHRALDSSAITTARRLSPLRHRPRLRVVTAIKGATTFAPKVHARIRARVENAHSAPRASARKRAHTTLAFLRSVHCGATRSTRSATAQNATAPHASSALRALNTSTRQRPPPQAALLAAVFVTRLTSTTRR